ncbi:ATP-binding protein, partial [Streptomyces sp. TRM76130]|nr:ATP-binding protein [Streptomyces sp. TRM76130]
LSEDAVRHLLARPAAFGPAPAAAPDAPDAPEPNPAAAPPVTTPPVTRAAPGDRLDALAARLGLTDTDAAVLLIALAPDLDRAFESLYGYLNDDVSRRRATVALALELCGLPVHDAAARARLHPSAPLTALGLLELEEPERPFLSRSLRVPDRLASHLLGDDTPDAALAGHIRALTAPVVPYDDEGGDGAQAPDAV